MLLAAIVGVLGHVVEVGAPVAARMAAGGTREGVLAVPAMDWLVDVQLELRCKQLAAHLKQHGRGRLHKHISLWIQGEQ